MKKCILIATLFSCLTITAQDDVKQSNDVIKERKEMAKLTSKAVDAKVTKNAKKQAKVLQKEGWKPGPGTLPIVNQLDNFYRKRVELKGDAPKYIIGTAENTGNNYTAAKKAALEFARQNVAEQINSEFAELINSKVGNSEIGKDDAESITQIVNESKTLVQQKIGRLIIVTEFYKEVNDKVKVQLGVTYDSQLAKSDIMKSLESASEETRQQLEEITQDWGK